jgi:aldehyde:ferredoxin oxidoreductase
MGRVLEVDLTSGSARALALDERLAELFLGGRGLGTALLVQRLLRLRDRHRNPFLALDPFAPENPLVLATSPANGTSVPTSARFHANFKSPLTGGIGSTNSGGRWGVEFKRTGHDAMIVTPTACGSMRRRRPTSTTWRRSPKPWRPATDAACA